MKIIPPFRLVSLLSSLFFCAVLIAGCSKTVPTSEETSLKELHTVISYNIKNDYDKTGPNNWSERKQQMGLMLKEWSPTFLGIQEALENQVVYLAEALPNHAVIGVGRDDGKQAGEFCAIYYDTTQYRLIETKTIWLSTTPNQVSTGWDAALPRIATFGLFINKSTNDSLLVCNTHFDHIGAEARAESAKLIIKEMAQSSVTKQLLLGDFNATLDQQPIQRITSVLSNAQALSSTTNTGPLGTFNGFNKKHDNRIIDFIFLGGFPENTVTDYQHIDPRLTNGNFVSDHFAVMAKITF